MWVEIEAFLSRKAGNTQRRYRSVLRDWLSFLGATPGVAGALAITGAEEIDAERYVSYCQTRPAQAGRNLDGSPFVDRSTVAGKVEILSLIYDRLVAVKLAPTNPFKRLKEEYRTVPTGNKRPHEFIPVEKVAEMMRRPAVATIEGLRDFCMLGVMCYMAFRRTEARTLRICDVKVTDNGSAFIELVRTKAGRTRRVAVPDALVPRLLELQTKRRLECQQETGPLFTMYTSGAPTNLALSDSSVARYFKFYLRQAGLSPRLYSCHSARATAITRALDLGMTHREVAQDLSGHSSVAMVERYDKRRKSVDESAVKKLHYDVD